MLKTRSGASMGSGQSLYNSDWKIRIILSDRFFPWEVLQIGRSCIDTKYNADSPSDF
jgi:hypothetical protein